MAVTSDTLELALRVMEGDSASKLKATAQAARDAAEAEAKLRAETERLAAAERLRDLAAQNNRVEQLAIALRKQRDEIARLAEVTGDHATAARAVAAAEARFSEQLDKTGRTTTHVTKATAVLSETQAAATKNTGDAAAQFGRASATLVRLGGALQVVNPALGSVVGGITEATNAFSALGVAGSSFMAIAAPVAIAIAALGAAHRKLAKDAEEAAKRQREAAEAAAKMREITMTLEQKRETAALRAAVVEGTLSPDVVKAREAQLQAEADFAGAVAEEKAKQAKAEEAIAAARAAQAEGIPTSESAEAIKNATVQYEAAQRAIEEYDRQTAIHAANLLTASTATKTSTKETGKHTEVLEEDVKVTEKEVSAWGDFGDNLARVAEIRSGMNSDQLTEEQRITQTYREQFRILDEIEREMRRQGADEESLAEVTAARLATQQRYMRELAKIEAERLGTEQEILETKKDEFKVADEQAALAAQERADRIAGTIGTVGGIVAGNAGALYGAIGSAGPWGAIISAILSAVTMLGDKGAEGVQAGWQDLNDDLVNGIRELPTILADVLPEMSIQITEGFTDAVISNLPAIIEGLIEGILDASNQLTMDLPDIIVNAIIKAIQSLGSMEGMWDSLPDDGSGWADLLTGGWSSLFGFASGTDYVPKDGIYMLHAGEKVTPPGGAARGGNPNDVGATMGRGGGGVTINITGVVGPDVLAELNRQMKIYSDAGMF